VVLLAYLALRCIAMVVVRLDRWWRKPRDDDGGGGGDLVLAA
jgi:hypothetical protein